jgi:hypothetical protein
MDNLDKSFWRIGIFGIFIIVFAEMTACAFNQVYAQDGMAPDNMTQVYAQDGIAPDNMTQVMDGYDEGTYHVQLAHTFPYFGKTFTDAWMSTNGFILLYDPISGVGNPEIYNSFCCNGENFTHLNSINAQVGRFSYMIAPLWTDLIDMDRTQTDGYYYSTDKEKSRFLWYNVKEFYDPEANNTFGVELRPDGSFDFYYDEVSLLVGYTSFVGYTGDLVKDTEAYTTLYFGEPDGSNLASLADMASETFYDQNGDVDGYAWYSSGSVGPTGPDCSDPLNDSTCPGYEEAYFEQQCTYNPQYDMLCPGYIDESYTEEFAAVDTFQDDVFDEPYEDVSITSMGTFDGQSTGADDGTNFEDSFGVSEEDFYGFDSTGSADTPDPTETAFTETGTVQEELEFFPEPVVQQEESFSADVAEVEEVQEIYEEPIEDVSFEEEIALIEEDVSNSEEDILIKEESIDILEERVDAVNTNTKNFAISLSLQQTSNLISSLETNSIESSSENSQNSGSNDQNSQNMQSNDENSSEAQENVENSQNYAQESASDGSFDAENQDGSQSIDGSGSEFFTSAEIFGSDAQLFTAMTGGVSDDTSNVSQNEQTEQNVQNEQQNLALGEAAPIGFSIIPVPQQNMEEEVVQEKSLAERMADANIEKRKEKSNIAAQGQTAAVEQLAATADMTQYYNTTLSPEVQVYSQSQVYSGVRLEDNNRTMYNMFSESTGKMGQLIRSQY